MQFNFTLMTLMLMYHLINSVIFYIISDELFGIILYVSISFIGLIFLLILDIAVDYKDLFFKIWLNGNSLHFLFNINNTLLYSQLLFKEYMNIKSKQGIEMFDLFKYIFGDTFISSSFILFILSYSFVEIESIYLYKAENVIEKEQSTKNYYKKYYIMLFLVFFMKLFGSCYLYFVNIFSNHIHHMEIDNELFIYLHNYSVYSGLSSFMGSIISFSLFIIIYYYYKPKFDERTTDSNDLVANFITIQCHAVFMINLKTFSLSYGLYLICHFIVIFVSIVLKRETKRKKNNI